MQIQMTIKGLMVDPMTNMPIVVLRDLDQLAKEVDLRKFVATIGPKRFRKEVGTRWLFSDLSEKERQELLKELTK